MSRYLAEPAKMKTANWRNSSRYLNNSAEQNAGKTLSVAFLLTYYILPQYFGVRLPGFDMTAQRFLISVFCLFLLSKESRKKVFWEGVRGCKLWPMMAAYLGICFYTAVFRAHIGTFLYPLIELLGAFLVIYALREYLGSKGFFKLFRKMLLFLCLMGIVEAVLHKTPFAYLETIKGLYTGGMVRSGSYRIMGPANHSLAYGLILISGLPLLCMDEEKRCFDFFRHLPLLCLVVVNVFLTGSRSTLAVMGLELLLLMCLAPDTQRKKLLFTVVPAGILVLLLALLFPASPPGHYILLQLCTVLDEMFGTSYAQRFGVDAASLANSASYREALLDIFGVSWLNPWLGQGSGYHFSWYIPGGANIRSIDNFYVANYIRYGYPGLVVYGLLIVQAVWRMVRRGIGGKDKAAMCMALAVCGYFLNLWWMDTLQTIKYAYLPIALFEVWIREQTEGKQERIPCSQFASGLYLTKGSYVRTLTGMLAGVLTGVLTVGSTALAAPRKIPDRFNTGVDGTELTVVTSEGNYGGIRYRIGAGGQLVLDPVYSNRLAGQQITVQNLDFSGYSLLMVNEDRIEEDTEVCFRNCRFDAVVTGREDARIHYTFEDCTLRSFQGSNAALTRCRLGGSSGDAVNPYRNVILWDCYIADLAHPDSEETVHSDGVQIFGYPSLPAENIAFYNCRFEVPAIPGGASYVNACLMIAPEKSGGKNIIFENCILNGGGYAIYTLVKDDFTLENVVLRNLRVGDGARYGTFYHRNVTEGVRMEGITQTDTLYVGSRFLDEQGLIHFSVTNDTAQIRKLLIVTPTQKILLSIAACPPYEERTEEMRFEDFPFDVDVAVPGASWAVCYDVTDGCTQIALYAERRK